LGTSVEGIVDGDIFILNDGAIANTFEFSNGDGVDPEHVRVFAVASANAGTVQTAMIDAINAQGVEGFTITASAGGGADIDLSNSVAGTIGNIDIDTEITTGWSLNEIGMDGGTEGGADLTVGEFNLGLDLDANSTADNIVDTLADPTFDAEITGVAVLVTVDATDVPGVRLIRDIPGLTNNEIIPTLAVTVNPGFVVTGFERGSDLYINVSPDAFAEGLRTKNPSVSATSEDKDKDRRKYRSRAIAVPSSFNTGVNEISLVIHNPEDVTAESIRIRPTRASDPGNWQDYEAMTLLSINPNIAQFTKDFGQDVFKVQLEMFGTYTDFSITDISNVLPPNSGPTGPSGVTGTDGEDGAVGPQGPAGAAGGATGASGATGEAGPQGITGTDGEDGTDGVDGDVGPAGPVSAEFFHLFFNTATTWVVNHNLDTIHVLVATYDASDEQIIPASIEVVNTNTVTITFATATAGRVVIVAEA
jgi:hypothetical protein